MKLSLAFSYLLLYSLAADISYAQICAAEQPKAPYIVPDTWLPDFVDYEKMATKDVNACCAEEDNVLKRVSIGNLPQFTTEDALKVLDNAVDSWKGGAGVWPQLSLSDRISAIQKFLKELEKVREPMIDALMWEIGKTRKDAASEFDRTLKFARAVIQVVQNDSEYTAGAWQVVGQTRALVRRAALGVIMCLGPYNYPLNETYATLIPALLLGNICILKIPTIGGLVHLLTMGAFRESLPEGTIHFIAGSGRKTMPPIMKTGKVDALAFIGGQKAADELIHSHPHPHRLKVFLQLEAKNLAIYLPQVFEDAALLKRALAETIKGTLSYNGQRCTALKLLMVPRKYADTFVKALKELVEDLVVSPSWDPEANVTPLPSPQRISYMKELLEDALKHGAKIINKNGGEVIGGEESTLMTPAVVYPVASDMRLYSEEQFGPIIPVVAYDDLETDVLQIAQDSEYGQQVSVFGAQDSTTMAYIVDRLATVYGKVNINTQCGRSPDTIPFSGRRSSAMGTMSVSHALTEFSIPAVVSHTLADQGLVDRIESESTFLQPIE